MTKTIMLKKVLVTVSGFLIRYENIRSLNFASEMRQYLQKFKDTLSDLQKQVDECDAVPESKPETIISVSGGKPVFKPLKRSARFLSATRILKPDERKTIIATTETTGSKILDTFKYFEMDSQNNKVMSPISLLGGFYMLALTASGDTRTKIVNHFYPGFKKESILIVNTSIYRL